MKSFLLLCMVTCQFQAGNSFIPGSCKNVWVSSTSRNIINDNRLCSLPPTKQEDATISSGSAAAIENEASKLKRQAEQMRLEAEKLDLALTSQKIDTIEQRLNNPAWLEKHPKEAANLKKQLQQLNNRLLGNDGTASSSSSSRFFPPTSSASEESETKTSTADLTTNTSSTTSTATSTNSTLPSTSSSSKVSTTKEDLEPPKKKKSTDDSKSTKFPKNPISGFDEPDLEVYLPVAKNIDERLSNATIKDKVEAFRSAPELQDYFKEKVQSVLVGPLEELQNLETLKKEYLDSTSSKEKEALKRKIDRIEDNMEEDGPYVYSDSVYLDDFPQITEEEIEERMEALQALPEVLRGLYKHRCGLTYEGDLRLAIEVDHYEPQLQLLEQIRFVQPLPEEMKGEFIQAFDSLPSPVQTFFVENQGLNTTEVKTAEDAIKAMVGDTSSLSPMMQVMAQANGDSEEPPEYTDIEYIDRSRYVEEFFPNVAGMEGKQIPKLEDVERFTSEVLDSKVYMVTSKPERVAGGYYIRGRNFFEDEDDGSDKMIQRIKEKLDASDLAEKLECYYILDPSPPTDEEIELESTMNPVLLVISKERDLLLNPASALTKLGVSSLTALTALMFSTGACALNPVLADRFTTSLDAAAAGGTLDLQWLADLSLPTFYGILGIQAAHELAHRVIGWKDKFDVGTPTFVPSLQLGITGAITPLQSAPPNFKSLFDFSMAGPLVGLIVSSFLLASGLSMTASMDPNIALPVVPVDLLRASSFVGGMTSFFLGKGALMPNQGIEAVVELHPYAIAGLVGCFSNALALLPLGHTDGGRISTTMFGRRGSFVVKLLTSLLLLAGGLFGLDEVNILLVYVLFVSLWQRELETPVLNEVDELDFPRGLLGISSALLVALILLPML